MIHLLGNSELDIEIALIKMERALDTKTNSVRDRNRATIPVDVSSILNLEISESSLTMGAKGSITINNNFRILEKLKITTNSSYDLYVAINIVDKNLSNIDIDETSKVIRLTGLVKNTAGASANAVDNIITFEFEEALVAQMRTTNISLHPADAGLCMSRDQKRELQEKRGGVVLEEPLITESNAFGGGDSTTTSGYTMADIADQFYEDCYKLKDMSAKSIVVPARESSTPNLGHALPAAMATSNHDIDSDLVNVSTYSVVKKMADRTLAENGDKGRVSYFRLVNYQEKSGEVVRKFKFDAFMTDRHQQFVTEVANYKEQSFSENDFSDVWLEKFSFNPLGLETLVDPNISSNNHIEKYNITRADVAYLRETTWGNYKLRGSELGVVGTTTKGFGNILQDYFANDLSIESGESIQINAPLLDVAALRKFTLAPQVLLNQPGVGNGRDYDNKSSENYIGNRVRKSFLTINETITFSVKGQIYRRPNMFIWIERGEDEADYKKLWYVNHVTHRIANGEYTTEVIATKLFGETTNEGIEANRIFEEERVLKLNQSKAEVGPIATEESDLGREAAIRDSLRRGEGSVFAPYDQKEFEAEQLRKFPEDTARVFEEFFNRPLTQEEWSNLTDEQKDDLYNYLQAEERTNPTTSNIESEVPLPAKTETNEPATQEKAKKRYQAPLKDVTPLFGVNPVDNIFSELDETTGFIEQNDTAIRPNPRGRNSTF